MSEQNDVIYALADNGDLLWYRHDGRADGSFNWATGSGNVVGTSWNFKQVFSGGNGVIYALRENGELLWYRHIGRGDGTFTWAEGSGNVVGTGWDFMKIFPSGSGDGVIYVIPHNEVDPVTGQIKKGDLLWYRHDGWRDGSFTWAAESGQKVGHQWDGFADVFGGGEGVIYGIKPGGELVWYCHEGRGDGTFAWAPNSGNTIGHGWDSFASIFPGGGGVIYAIEKRGIDWTTGHEVGGHLLWYRHDGWRDGSEVWAGGYQTVGNRWDVFTTAFFGGDGFQVYGWIGAKYAELGGPASWLGWPISDEQDFPQGGRASLFENGAIYWWPDTGAIELGRISLQYKGLFCFGETDESSEHDEPYVIFGVVPVPPGQPSDAMTQIYTDVDAGDARPDLMEIYQGLPYGAAIGVTLAEHDYGDPNKFREQVKQGVAAAGQGVAAGCAAVPYIGFALVFACKALWEEFSDEIVGFVNGILGTDDDIIEKWTWQITPKEMVTLARTPTINYHGIDYHLESKLLSDGDASYKVYLAISAI